MGRELSSRQKEILVKVADRHNDVPWSATKIGPLTSPRDACKDEDCSRILLATSCLGYYEERS